MSTLLITLEIIVAVAMVGVILLQRSEGGALGIGGGGGMFNTRQQANLLTRITAILATCFFVLLLLISIFLSGDQVTTPSLFDQPEQFELPVEGAPVQQPDTPLVPAEQEPLGAPLGE